MQTVELKALEYFLYILVHDYRIWVQVPQIALMPKYPKTGTTQPTDEPYT